jgi:hypothetical protein
MEHPIAWPARELSIRLILDRALGARTARHERLFECNSLRLMAALAREGGCIAFKRFGINDVAERAWFHPLSDRSCRRAGSPLCTVGARPENRGGAFLELAAAAAANFDVRK